MRIPALLLLLLIALGSQSCGSDCGRAVGRDVNQITNPHTFIQVNWKNRIPRYVHYPTLNKTDSVFLISVKDRFTNKPKEWIHGFFLNSKENSSTVLIRYDVGEDTVVLIYSCGIIYTGDECGDEFQIVASGVSLSHTTGDSIYMINKQLFLP